MMSNRKLFINIIFWFSCSLFWFGPAYPAVQLGNHMDLILNNGTIVRVFPKAESSGSLERKPIPRYDPKVSSKPLGGDPCLRLEKEYKQRSAKKKSIFEILKHKKSKKPSWLKQTKRVKGFQFSESAASEAKPIDWYYLPTEPRLSFKNGVPEATFVKFITDEESGGNAAEGAIFHLMVTYGLTPAEEDELTGLLEDAVPNARLMGQVDLEPAKTGDNFIVTSGTLSDKGFAPEGVLTSGRAPTVAGSKASVAGRLSSLGAQLMVKTFENPTADMSVTFTYDYIAKVPAFTGQVRIDLDKIRETAECSLKTHDERKKKSGFFGGITGLSLAFYGDPLGLRKSSKTVRISNKELEEAYETMVTLGAIEIIIDQNLPDADVAVIEASLMDMALASFTNMQKTFMTNKEFAQAPPAAGTEGSNNRRDPASNHWEVYKLKRKREKMSGTILLNITKNVAVYRTHAMTGNLGGMLGDHKGTVFSEVLLNDPFFKRGKITVDLDTEALELFENKLVNNASIKVIVPFQGEASYENNDIFTSKDVLNGKIVSQFSFATRGEDKINQSCPYKYIESWSLRGGGKWPKNPQAVCSSEMSVTLVPPVKMRRIEVEADLGEMEDAGFRAADVVLRHTRYGKQATETAKLRVAKGEPYVEVDLVVDKDSDAVEYRLILTHKDKGQLQPSPWQPLDGDFVYASIGSLPIDFLKEINELVPQIQQVLPIEIQDLLVSKATELLQ